MPNQINDDEIIIGDETDPVTTDDQTGEDTSTAENNEDPNLSSPTTTPADDDAREELEAKLKEKSRSEAKLGKIATKATKLIGKSPEDIKEELEDNPNLKKYFRKRNPDLYNDLFGEKEETNEEDIVDKAVQKIEQNNQYKALEKGLQGKVKGLDNFNKTLGFAKTLLEKGATTEEAVSGALATSQSPSTQPTVPNGSRRREDSDGIVLSKSKILKLGLDPKLVEKQAKEGKLSATTLNNFKK